MPLTRRDIILGGANQDGGAHVDAEPDVKTKSLLKSMGSVMPHPRGRGNSHSKTSIFIFIRQFAYEVLNSPDITRAADG